MTERRARRFLAWSAAALAAGALAASVGRRPDLDELARTVVAEGDHVDAVRLAAWIRERRSGVHVVDVRDSVAFEALHIPGARRLDLTALIHTAFPPGDTVVLYSEGGTHAAQGWFFLRAAGLRHVYFLRGGLYEWVATVLEPTLPADPTPAERAAFTRAAELSRYFGGLPRTGVRRVGAPDVLELPPITGPSREAGRQRPTLRRRGC